MFISLDGIDGGGKSTQIRMLKDWLEAKRVPVVCFRDPGSTKLGESIRDILLHREEIPLASTSEMLLYMAARAQLVEEQIRPALNGGSFVICDRFLLANVVYQGCGGGLDLESLWKVGRIATGGLSPDITFILDIPVAEARKRLQGEQDRLEKRGADYFERVRQGFLEQSSNASPEVVVVDATRDPDSIQRSIRECLADKI